MRTLSFVLVLATAFYSGSASLECIDKCALLRDNLIPFYRCMARHYVEDRCSRCEREFLPVHASLFSLIPATFTYKDIRKADGFYLRDWRFMQADEDLGHGPDRLLSQLISFSDRPLKP
jgi:hypothetical protein